MKNKFILITNIIILFSSYQSNFTMTINDINEDLQNIENQINNNLNTQQILFLEKELTELQANLEAIQNSINANEYQSLISKIQILQRQLNPSISIEKIELNIIQEKLSTIQKRLENPLINNALDNLQQHISNILDQIATIKNNIPREKRVELGNKIQVLNESIIIEKELNNIQEELQFTKNKENLSHYERNLSRILDSITNLNITGKQRKKLATKIEGINNNIIIEKDTLPIQKTLNNVREQLKYPKNENELNNLKEQLVDISDHIQNKNISDQKRDELLYIIEELNDTIMDQEIKNLYNKINPR